MKIRTLKPGEPIPGDPPRRYLTDNGYIRLRWRIGTQSYVECYEHRVIDGHVTTAAHVHHINRDRTDNRPENLEHLTEAEHHERHAGEYDDEAIRLYAEGHSTVEVARRLGLSAGWVSRILAAHDVPARGPGDYYRPVDLDAVAQMHAAGVRMAPMAKALGVGHRRVRRALLDLGLPLPGRPRAGVLGVHLGPARASRCPEPRRRAHPLGRQKGTPPMTATLLRRPPDWSAQAACIGLATPDRDLWAPGDHLTPEEKGFELHLARRICASCPVRIECLVDELHALPRHTPEAMRGGLTPDEIIDRAQTLGLPYVKATEHGKRSTYVGGCRCALCRDAHRIYEHERRLWAKSKKPQLTAGEVAAWLSRPRGRGKHRAEAGQLLLFTDGLPKRYIAQPRGATA